MKFTKIIILSILLNSVYTIGLNAQKKEVSILEEKEILKGLIKATENELAVQNIMLDGESIPIYTTKGKRLKGKEMMEAMMSGNYVPEFYMNAKKEIKVAVLTRASEEEKKMMLEMQPGKKSELIDAKAPVFSATDIHDNNYTLNQLKGKIIVLNFWFVECKPCVMEIPDLNELVEKYKDKEVVFLGFATNKKSKIIDFLEEKNFDYTIIPDSRKIAKAYNVKGYPTHIIINQNSKIVHATSGLSTVTVSNLDKTIESLIEKP